VITVAPQNDICPHGRTYPRKAVAIKANKIITPEIQTWVFLYAENSIPRLMWMYTKMKNIEAPFIWTLRIIHP